MRSNQNKTKRTQLGFTLIEVMIALIIAAVSLIALSTTLGQYVFNQASIKERVVATWVAQNRLLEIQTAIGSSGSRLDKKQKETMLEADWQTEFEFEPTLIPGLRKVNIDVTLEGAKHVSAKIVSIVGG